MRKIFTVLLLSISLTLFACSNDQVIEDTQTETEEVATFSVNILLTIPEELDQLESTQYENVEAEEGDTIIDVTEKTDIRLNMNGSGADAYVEGINNLNAFDEGPNSGWLVKVNGEFINEGPGTYEVQADDEIEWLFTTDFNKEFE